MCGRFALGIPKKRLEEVFGLPAPDDYRARYNVAPGTEIVTVTEVAMAPRRWGLVPRWAESAQVGYKMINARSETVFDKPSFKESVRTARCLIPAQAFYEWRRQGDDKRPFAIKVTGTDVFAMAGIAASRQDRATGEVVESCAILTCAPNAVMEPIHDRMPVILPAEAWGRWLDAGVPEPSELAPLLVPFPAKGMRAWSVSPAVNRVAVDTPELLEPAPNASPVQGSLL